MKKNNQEIEIATSIENALFQLRQRALEKNERETADSRGIMQRIFLGNPNEELIRKRVSKQQEKEKVSILKLLKALEAFQFVIDSEAHKVAQMISNQLLNRFPTLQPQFVMFGSTVTGAQATRKTLGVQLERNPDLDCGVLLGSIRNGYKAKIDSEEFFQNNVLLNEVTDFITKIAAQEGFQICDTLNPRLYHGPRIFSVQQAEAVLESYFGVAHYGKVDDSASLYLFPSYPIKVWAQNLVFFHEALKNIRRKSKSKHQTILRNIRMVLKHNIKFSQKHFTGEKTFDRSTPEYALATETARLLTEKLSLSRADLGLTQKPHYTVV